MNPFKRHEGIVAPLARSNVDTDAILPKQFLKSVKRTGFGANLFDDWRYLDPYVEGQGNGLRRPNAEFILNRPEYADATILLTRENFGCGSSREHAPWALVDYGFRVVIASSFADIFFSNCFKNGLLPVRLDPIHVDRLFKEADEISRYEIVVDLEEQIIRLPNGDVLVFSIDEFRRHCLLNGLDEIGFTLQHQEEVADFEAKRLAAHPWLNSAVTAHSGQLTAPEK